MLFAYLILAIAINLVGFLIAYFKKSDKLTDFSYVLTFVVIAVLAAIEGGNDVYRLVLVDLIVLWAVRLGGFLMIRIFINKTDRRFDKVRDNFLKFGTFWLSQAFVAWLLVMPAVFALGGHGSELTRLAYAGVVVSAIGLSIETLADYEKFTFSQRHKGRFIMDGLWKYSRHPNYFGEIVFWLGIYIYSYSYLESWQRAVGLISPLLISYLLIYVTGVPKLEKYADQKWGRESAYKSYKQRTSLLIPMPSKVDN